MEKQMIQRKENWPMLLSEYITKIREKPFKRGVNDCCFMPANCVKALTGYDPAKAFRGKIKSLKDVDFVMDEYHGLVGLFNHCLGFEPHNNKYAAMRGDVVIARINDQEYGGIVDDTGRFILVFEESVLTQYPISHVTHVWGY